MMKTMKKHIYLLVFLLSTLTVYAQQDPMFTQYMNNPISINPAIAGSREVANLTSIFRKQWIGIDGAPSTMSLTFDNSFKENKVGLGTSIIYDVIGPVIQTGLYFDYSYHLMFEDQKKLSLGLMGGFNYYHFDLVNLRSYSEDDDIATDGYSSKFLPNFGVGIFYYTPNFFIGASVPKLLQNSLEDSDESLESENREERHYFLMSGCIFNIDEDIKLKPSAITRIVAGSPVNFDLNLTLMLKDKFWIGATYRFKNSVGGIVRWQLNDQLHLGYSYDYSTSLISNYNYGSHEIFISYDFIRKGERKIRQRFF